MLRELCSRGLGCTSSVAVAFEHIYVQPDDNAEGRAAAEAAFSAICVGSVPPGSEAGAWLQPGAWPTPASAEAFAADSLAAEASRDCSLVLHWAGEVASFRLEDETSAALADPSWLGAHGVGAAAVVPGRVLGRLLLGAQPETMDETGTSPGFMAAAALQMALRVYMERGAQQPRYPAWAAACLHQCAAVVGGAGAPASPHPSRPAAPAVGR